ncbi:ABC transporter ATP-binding protein [Trueperella pyogenes]|uniref:ABC transporter ATP-binding protein n=1 Tax=Trueperella pyogenes TaxID=1661 RepID=UPI002168F6F7|nr:ABC transporter ATP-binding protein [Trueperella pyogenes]UVJ56080.1 ABC transporter ATP-binding protein [Trueperella pyogenes]WHU58818.1 ABC transporter ATP-binding protein [Trueperella pyogenes]
MDNAIYLDNVTKVLGKEARTKNLSAAFAPGQVYGLLGPNGAGKSTLINLITGLYRPTSGTVRVFGLDPVKDAKRVRKIIGLVPQETALYPELSAIDNLKFHAALYTSGANTAGKIRDILELVELSDRAKEPVGTYSGGMKRRLAIGRALLSDPKLLLLDEPTLGVDVQGAHRIWDYIDRFRSEGRTVLVSTNVMSEADRLADKIALLDHGTLIRFDTPAALKAEVGHSVTRVLTTPTLDDVFLHLTGRNLRD